MYVRAVSVNVKYFNAQREAIALWTDGNTLICGVCLKPIRTDRVHTHHLYRRGNAPKGSLDIPENLLPAHISCHSRAHGDLKDRAFQNQYRRLGRGNARRGHNRMKTALKETISTEPDIPAPEEDYERSDW